MPAFVLIHMAHMDWQQIVIIHVMEISMRYVVALSLIPFTIHHVLPALIIILLFIGQSVLEQCMTL